VVCTENYYHDLEDNIIQILKHHINQKVSKTLPGLIHILNVYCKTKIGNDFYTLLAKTPCNLYKSIAYFYKDELTSNIVLKLILKAIIEDEDNLNIALNYIKNCRSKEFIDILYKTITQLQY